MRQKGIRHKKKFFYRGQTEGNHCQNDSQREKRREEKRSKKKKKKKKFLTLKSYRVHDRVFVYFGLIVVIPTSMSLLDF